MEELIADIINYRCQKNNLFTNNEIRKILDIIIENENLKDFVKSIYISDTSREKMAAYFNQTELKIVIYVNHLYEYLQNKNNCESVLDINLLFVNSLLHELEHVDQYRKSLLDKKDFEVELIKTNYKYFNASFISSIYRKYLYKKYHDSFPLERLADIDSSKKTIKIANFFNKKEEYEKKHEQHLTSFYLDPILYLSPTEAFLDKIKSDLIRKQDFYDPYKFIMLEKIMKKYTLDERLRLGLPITSNEYRLIRKN